MEPAQTEKQIKNETSESQGPYFGIRHIQVILYFFLLGIAYSMRSNLSVGIVAMNSKTSENPNVPVFDWDDQSLVLSSFYWGYVVLQLPAGYFGKIYGPKWFLVVTMSVNSLVCILTPFISETLGSKGAIGCRVTQGLFQGFFFPSTHNLLSKWVPPSERSTLTTFAYSGCTLGTIIAIPITGMISSSWVGWPASFYVFGGVGILWVIIWILLGANSPAEHKFINKKEKDYIESSLDQQGEELTPPTPWKKIFTSMPVWAIIVANFGQNWGYVMLLTEIPTFLSGYMGFDMNENKWLSAAPYAASALLGFIFGPISDFISVLVPAIALIALGFVPKDQSVLCISLLVIAVGINAALICGYQVNHMDLSPVYAGTLMGLANGPANSFSIIGPLVVQYVVGEDTGNQVLWREVFMSASAVYVVSGVFYIIFAKGEIQSWNYEYLEEKKNDSNKEPNTEKTVVDMKF